MISSSGRKRIVTLIRDDLSVSIIYDHDNNVCQATKCLMTLFPIIRVRTSSHYDVYMSRAKPVYMQFQLFAKNFGSFFMITGMCTLVRATIRCLHASILRLQSAYVNTIMLAASMSLSALFRSKYCSKDCQNISL